MRRRIVLGFFDTLYWSRQFKRHMELKRSARMTAIPQLDVPEILVDNEEDRSKAQNQVDNDKNKQALAGFRPAMPTTTLLSADDARVQRTSWTGLTDISSFDTSYGHPLAFPTSSPASPSHRNQPSAFSFELQEAADGDGDGTSGGGSRGGSRRGSSVSPAQVREMLDDSVWMASIRRSATTRRGDWSGGY